MFVIDHKQMAKEKVNQIRKGRSAYAESANLVSLIKKELECENIKVYEDVTEFGCWFIPVREEQ
ncbi:hypothetical protein [Bacillus alveayuensis]|uniref:Uncharacterized protein n=1 Tax=Aeribacillus alveayuensis TaxID=279215 RepID=A0ABT9VJC8_9BACI|nr:hypothetical protein [Bacillus alveayuensis]MDQ0161077.1 hypothetical protein [Bacillus alveayuensis]